MPFKHNLIYTALFASVSLNLAAQTSDATLEQIEVKAELEQFKANPNLKADVNLSLLGKQLAFTSPISVVNYDEKAFTEKEPRNVVDAIAKTDASVMNFGGETNTLQGIYVRGLQLDARQFSVNGLAGLYSTYYSPTAAVSAAQLIKGASTATVGMDPEGSAGASLNIETKRATNEGINRIGFAWFSQNRLQQSFDIGHRFGANNEWGVRINGKYRDGKTARTGYDERAKEIAIGADYRGERLRVGVDYLQNQRQTHGGRARLHDMQNLTFTIPAAPNGQINLVPRWSAQATEDSTAMITFEYDLLPNLMLAGGLGHMESRYDGSFTQLTMRNKQGDYRIANATAFDFRSRTTSGNLKLQGDFATGDLNHYWNLAFDSVTRKRDHDNNPSKTRSGQMNTNIYTPTFIEKPAFSALTQGVDTKLVSQSVAASDTLGIWDDKIRLTLGGRFQWIKQTDYAKNDRLSSHRFSPMLAISYAHTPNFVFYSNYLEDLEPGKVDIETGEMHRPRVTKQVEAGVRKNWGENVTTTFSAYQISRPGIIRGNSKAMKARANQTQGKERNRGVEFNLYTRLFDNSLRTHLGISYNQGKVIDFPTYADTIVSGVQVTSPRLIAKANIEWDTPLLANLTLNAGLQHYGKSYQDTAAKYKLPSYTTVDAGAKYTLSLAGKQQLVLRFGVENLFNTHYWQVQRGQYDRSFAVLGMPRTYWLKTDYSF